MHPLPGGSGASAVGIEAGAGGEPGRAREHLATGGATGGGGGATGGGAGATGGGAGATGGGGATAG